MKQKIVYKAIGSHNSETRDSIQGYRKTIVKQKIVYKAIVSHNSETKDSIQGYRLS